MHGRSIPACAGQSYWQVERRALREVDPRVRGAVPSVPSVPSVPWGRSPRARGSRSPRARGSPIRRSIPACAGQSIPTKCLMEKCRVDPRVRGAVRLGTSVRPAGAGRSPRARGSHSPAAPPPLPFRSIPACAGQSAAKKAASASPWVDPRVRGAVSASTRRAASGAGRSPRARGSHWLRLSPAGQMRSIPACAGQSLR